MELQTIFEEFEVLTDEELMEVSGGTNTNYQNWISPLLDIGSEGDIYSRY
ncbi:bacteriocin class II family protein [Lactococcus lactis]|jgi:bacteriocin-like protein|nr:bacteriocin class II family protein [Lactococcus lactis]MDT2861584.1 bacteriocin class II family protein [Lactococcus lactis]MDT2870335.1 bacteriocin class II family protein [Lactococcus lactis]MDT2889083.1 bacteriocin class II family protein [Lactococcus lactis]MDT2891979.1 bacteriocin class II family protein [Lactococcus lactis]MDT2899493.1 bacteriocin class II family protein [Lactococcus lactis]